MTEYHTQYHRAEGESSQWEDIHRKLGNYAPAEPVWKPEPFVPAQDTVKDREWVDEQEADDLEGADDDFADDRFLEEYRYAKIERPQKQYKQSHRSYRDSETLACNEAAISKQQEHQAQRHMQCSWLPRSTVPHARKKPGLGYFGACLRCKQVGNHHRQEDVFDCCAFN